MKILHSNGFLNMKKTKQQKKENKNLLFLLLMVIR